MVAGHLIVGLSATTPVAAIAPAPNDGAVAPPVESVYFTSTQFPSGALITGYVECYFGCTADQIVFTDIEGNVLDGMFIDVSATRPDLGFAWQSSVALAVGSYYAALPSSYQSSSFSVVEATDELPTFTPGVSASTSGLGDPVQCIEEVVGMPAGSFYEKTLTEASLYVNVEGINATQYSYTIEVDMGAPENFQGQYFSRALGSEEVEICFQVFATPLTGGEETALGSDCVQTSQIEGLGESDEIFGNLDFVLGRCVVPPDGYETQWCDYFARASIDHSCDSFVYDACVAARYECPEGDLPEFEHTLVTEPDPDTTDDDDGDGGDGDRDPDQSGGCSVGAAGLGATRDLGLLLLLLLGATIVGRRRGSAAHSNS